MPTTKDYLEAVRQKKLNTIDTKRQAIQALQEEVVELNDIISKLKD